MGELRILLSPEVVKEVIHSLQVEVENIILEKLQNSNADLENVDGAMDENVIPDSNAKAKGKTVKEDRYKPLLNPKKTWHLYIIKVLVEFRQFSFKQYIKLVYILQEQRKIFFKKASKPIHFRQLWYVLGSLA